MLATGKALACSRRSAFRNAVAERAGAPIPVSGVVVIPAGHVPAGGRPIVSWAHPTTGIEPQ